MIAGALCWCRVLRGSQQFTDTSGIELAAEEVRTDLMKQLCKGLHSYMRCIMGVLSIIDRNTNNTCVTYARHGTEIHGLHVLDIHNRHAVQIHNICMIVNCCVNCL